VIVAVGTIIGNPIYNVRPVDAIGDEGIITGVTHAQIRINAAG
jgi:hypothetical protein